MLRPTVESACLMPRTRILRSRLHLLPSHFIPIERPENSPFWKSRLQESYGWMQEHSIRPRIRSHGRNCPGPCRPKSTGYTPPGTAEFPETAA